MGISVEFVRLFLLCCYFVSHGLAANTCQPLPTQKNTTIALKNLREQMTASNISVYVIFADDEHGSEYTQHYDKRRDWLSGFRGSAGTAVVSLSSAALWTDSRYFTEAEEELDCRNWLLMKSGEPNVPSLIDWFVDQANTSSFNPGTAPQFTSSSWWSSANVALGRIGKTLQAVDDLVGIIWPLNERPAAPKNKIVNHAIEYAGETIREKLARVAVRLNADRASATVISSLDEIAWLFNLRGSDIPNNPFFKSYAIVYGDVNTRKPDLFLNQSQLDSSSSLISDVNLHDYDVFFSRLKTIMEEASITRVRVSPLVSQAILNNIPESKVIKPLANSPVQSVKARKNNAERVGMKNCQIRDAVARMKHLGWLEERLAQGDRINETQSSDQLLIYQKEQDKFQFPSFNAISASGDRAAVVHYRPDPLTARQITKDKIYLLDAGGQYLDCTTDITRTHHFGEPSALEKRAYTRVLQGVLNVASVVFPSGTMGRSIDYLGRMALFKDGLTFGHTVGHGIGHYLSVHEGPQRIGPAYNQYEEGLFDGVFLSDEPGYYKPGDFGIRIENDIEVVKANNASVGETQYLRFDTITLVPYELSLIDFSLLSKEEITEIDQYHDRIWQTLSPMIQNDSAALNALRKRTQAISSLTTTATTISITTTTTSKSLGVTVIPTFYTIIVTFFIRML